MATFVAIAFQVGHLPGATSRHPLVEKVGVGGRLHGQNAAKSKAQAVCRFFDGFGQRYYPHLNQ
jgi:hypothetical protein